MRRMTFGATSAARMPRITTTTMISISVNPGAGRRFHLFISVIVFPYLIRLDKKRCQVPHGLGQSARIITKQVRRDERRRSRAFAVPDSRVIHPGRLARWTAGCRAGSARSDRRYGARVVALRARGSPARRVLAADYRSFRPRFDPAP